MKIIKEEINDYSLKIKVLLEIYTFNWENLAVDELVCASDNLNQFCKDNALKRHFFGVTENGFKCFDSGKSSKTANNSEKSNYSYALPVAEYNKLIGNYE
jgi:hypothetical protein